MRIMEVDSIKRLHKLVKSKLAERLGGGDEVLPEYVMVMVQNGKPKSQMRSDLEAFLGRDARSFVDWLWGVLKEDPAESGRGVRIPERRGSAETSGSRPDSRPLESTGRGVASKAGPEFVRGGRENTAGRRDSAGMSSNTAHTSPWERGHAAGSAQAREQSDRTADKADDEGERYSLKR